MDVKKFEYPPPTKPEAKHTQGKMVAKIFKEGFGPGFGLHIEGKVHSVASLNLYEHLSASVSFTEEEAEANGNRLALCWNTHDELIQALQTCLAIVSLQNGNLHDDINQIQKQAIDAIAAAEGVRHER